MLSDNIFVIYLCLFSKFLIHWERTRTFLILEIFRMVVSLAVALILPTIIATIADSTFPLGLYLNFVAFHLFYS